MRMVLVLVLAACGTDRVAPDRCESATGYLGAEVDCNGSAGLCVDGSDGPTCMPRCSDVRPACGSGEWWYTLVTDVGHACYCGPMPTP